jgi:hypothetical protein
VVADARPGTGRYVYAVTRAPVPDSLSEVPGVADAPLETVEHRGLVAVVSDVPLDDFGEEGLRRNLEDLGWLEKVARGHDAVVHAVAAQGATAPLRLATICLGDEGVRRRLDEWYDALDGALDRVEGRSEWSVKAIAPRRTDTSQAEQPDTEEAAGAGAGAAYLKRKRAQTLDRQTAEQAAVDAAEAVHTALAHVSVATRRLQPQDPRLTGHEGTMALNGAYLVAVEDTDAFLARAEELRAAHDDLRIEVHGPWPPYSFATLEQP